jgi:hypothetical protein
MDSITQLQNYVTSIDSFMTESLHAAWNESGSISVEQVQQAQREGQSAAAAAEIAADDGMPSVNGAPIPSLSAPLYSGLAPGVEFQLENRAHQLFKRVVELDALLQGLPPVHDPQHDLHAQLEQISFLQALSNWAGQELEQAQKEAALWQKRVNYVLQQTAACQLRTNTDHSISQQ